MLYVEVQTIQLSKDRRVIKCCKWKYKQYNCQRTGRVNKCCKWKYRQYNCQRTEGQLNVYVEVQTIQLSKDRGAIKCCKWKYRQCNCQRTEG